MQVMHFVIHDRLTSLDSLYIRISENTFIFSILEFI